MSANKSASRIKDLLKYLSDIDIEFDFAQEIMRQVREYGNSRELEGRKDQTFKLIQSLVKSGSISDQAASTALAIHTAKLESQKEMTQ